jgi:hypothetical protein
VTTPRTNPCGIRLETAADYSTTGRFRQEEPPWDVAVPGGEGAGAVGSLLTYRAIGGPTRSGRYRGGVTGLGRWFARMRMLDSHVTEFPEASIASYVAV